MSAAEFVRDLAEHGIRFDLNPTVDSNRGAAAYLDYIARIDATIRERAATALPARVDHAAEARDFLVRAGKQGEDPLGDALRLEALVHASLAVAEQQRIANCLQVALVDQLTQIALILPGPGYLTDPSVRIRDYLSPDDWEGLGL